MGSLGALLELLYRAHERVSCLEAEFRDWDHLLESRTVVVEAEESATPLLRWGGAGPRSPATERTRQMWFVSPDRLRVEVRRRDGSLVRLGVRDGSRWWRWGRQAAGDVDSTAGVDEASLPPLLSPPLLRPVLLIPALRLEATGTDVCAGREVTVARGWPQDPPPRPRELSYRLGFDAEHGTLLRREVFEDGRCVQATEALRVGYDVEIDPERFVYAPPP